MPAARWPWYHYPFRTTSPLQRQYPVRGLAICVGKQMPWDRHTLVYVVVDLGNAACHAVEPLQVLLVDGQDSKHAKLRIVHPLSVPNAALNDVDISIVHLFDEHNGLGAKQVVVPLLVADIPPT